MVDGLLICLHRVAFVMMHVAFLSAIELLSMALSYQTSAFEVARAYLVSTITPTIAKAKFSDAATDRLRDSGLSICA